MVWLQEGAEEGPCTTYGVVQSIVSICEKMQGLPILSFLVETSDGAIEKGNVSSILPVRGKDESALKLHALEQNMCSLVVACDEDLCCEYTRRMADIVRQIHDLERFVKSGSISRSIQESRDKADFDLRWYSAECIRLGHTLARLVEVQEKAIRSGRSFQVFADALDQSRTQLTSRITRLKDEYNLCRDIKSSRQLQSDDPFMLSDASGISVCPPVEIQDQKTPIVIEPNCDLLDSVFRVSSGFLPEAIQTLDLLKSPNSALSTWRNLVKARAEVGSASAELDSCAALAFMLVKHSSRIA